MGKLDHKFQYMGYLQGIVALYACVNVRKERSVEANFHELLLRLKIQIIQITEYRLDAKGFVTYNTSFSLGFIDIV